MDSTYEYNQAMLHLFYSRSLILILSLFEELGQTDPHYETSEDVTHPKKKKTLGSFFKATEGTTPRPTPQQQQQAIASELQSYLKSGNLDTEEDPLSCWREHQRLYPRLAKLAKKYLCIPATSSMSYRLRLLRLSLLGFP